MLKSQRPSIAMVKCAFGLVYLNMADDFLPMGEYLYVIDLSTLRLCPYEDGTASVMGWFQEKAPVTGIDGQPTVEVSDCPRGTLRRVVE